MAPHAVANSNEGGPVPITSFSTLDRFSANSHEPSSDMDSQDADTENIPQDGEIGDDEEQGPQPNQQNKMSEQKRRQVDIFTAHRHQLESLMTDEDFKPRDKKPNAEQYESLKDLSNQQSSARVIDSPRDYQMELFERAKKQNTIAVLDTGSGKTLIAVMLLRHFLEDEMEQRAVGKPKRIAFFLVCAGLHPCGTSNQLTYFRSRRSLLSSSN